MSSTNADYNSYKTIRIVKNVIVAIAYVLLGLSADGKPFAFAAFLFGGLTIIVAIVNAIFDFATGRKVSVVAEVTVALIMIG